MFLEASISVFTLPFWNLSSGRDESVCVRWTTDGLKMVLSV